MSLPVIPAASAAAGAATGAAVGAGSAWHLLTRLGEAQLLLPLMGLAVLWLVSAPEPVALRSPGPPRGTRKLGAARRFLVFRPGQARTALGWLAATTLAAAVTTASKVAFIGYGWGVPALDFTGFSGHAMFAAAVWPPLLRLAVAAGWPARPASAWGSVAGYALAAAVAVSRVAVGAHSWSEVLSGFALGAAASGAVLAAGHWPRLQLARLAPLALAALLALGVLQAPASRTHDWVTQLALATSGRATPFHRWMLHRPAPVAPAAGARSVAPSLQLR